MRSRVVACVALAALWTGTFLAQAPSQQQPGGTTSQGVIAGRVVDASTGQPLAGVTVSVGGGNVPNLLTGPDGQFSFRGLGRGSFTIAARRSGYIPGGFGVMRPGGSSLAIALGAGEQRTDAVVRLFRYASLTGTVVDDSGEPLVSVRVVAAQRVLSGGRRVSGQISVAMTDDRGVYRFGSVAPGEYIISVPVAQSSAPAAGRGGTFASRDQRFVSQSSMGSLAALPDAAGRLLSYATTYFPSARSAAQATPIVLSSGEERHGVDIVLSLRPTATVSGRVVGGPPRGGTPIQLRLSALDATDATNVPPEVDGATAIADADGSFTFLAVPAGRYVLQTSYLPQMEARPPATSGAPLPGLAWASVPVTVGADDVTDVVVTMQPGLAISGRIEFEGSMPTEGVRVSAAVTALDGSRGLGSSSLAVNPGAATSPFAMSARQPGRYALTATASPGGWALKSIVAGGLDLTDGFDLVDRDLTDIVITFTKQPSTIGGTVRTAQGTPDSRAVVLVFPSDSKYWQDYGPNPRRLTSARASQKGTFGPAPMPAGDYYVIAIAEEASDEWQDLRTLERLARQATRVTVTEGQQVTVDLTRRNVDPRTGFAHPAYRTYPAYRPYLAYLSFSYQIRDTRAALRSGTGSVSGVVRSNDDSSRPIPRARVSMRPIEGRQDYATLTDPAGRFTFPEIPQGRYTMTVTKPAYLTAHYGTGEGVLPPGLPVTVAEGQRVTDIALRLTRGGVISGVVVDEFGGPVFGASIQVWQPMEGGDGSRLARLVVQGSPITDDRGVYRIYGLQPGSFAVSANLLGAGQDLRLASNPSRAVTYAPIFHPGTPVASDAAFVRVASGQEVGGIDIPMRLVPTSRVEGTVTRSDGQPLKYVHVQLISQTPFQVPGAQTATGLTQQDARTTSFWFGAIPPGRYTAIARAEDQRPATARSGAANPLVWAQQEMDLMGDDVSGIALVLQPALTVSGRVVFEGTTSGALYGAGDLRVLATGSGVASTAAAQPPVEVDDDGRFTIPNLVPGEYRVTASALSLPGNAPVGIWSLVSAMSGGRDLLDYPLEVRPGKAVPEIVLTYTNQTSELTGRLMDTAGQPIADLTVLLFTADRGLWMPGSRRVRAPARPAGDGTFRFYNVPPGEYFLGVATDIDPKEASDPSFLERLAPAAIRLTIAPGEKKVQDLRIAGPPPSSALAARSTTRRARGR